MKNQSAATFADSKPHYALLDGLRGVAALLVVCYHVFEGYAFAGGGIITTLNHAHLAVDFFFMLSGFVVGYAYDDRLGSSLSLRGFFRRRLIRLHPLVMLGAVLGTVTFCLGGATQWDGSEVSILRILAALVCGMLLIPAWPGSGADVRGNGEMFSLNGPSWSLFFEYIGNLLYALFLRLLPTRILAGLAILLGSGLLWFGAADVMGYGSIGVGWSLGGLNFPGGLLRLLFPFCTGLLLARLPLRGQVRGAFWLCSAALVVLFAVPYVPGNAPVCINGLYESACVVFVFPALILLGASGRTTDAFSTRACRLLGDLSFPLYVVHYPVMYLFYAHLIRMKEAGATDFSAATPYAIAAVAVSLALAYIALRFYDIPLRRKLSRRA